MKLLLVRHGQTQANAEHRYLGALDPPLNDTGLQQARTMAAALDQPVDAVYGSPLLRASQTAEIMADTLRLPVRVDAAFRERHVGVFEGLTQEEARHQFPALWAMNITRQWHAAPDGGETIAAVFERVDHGLARLVKAHPEASVLLVAHGFVAKVLRALVLGSTSDFFDWQLDNGAMLTLCVPSDFQASS